MASDVQLVGLSKTYDNTAAVTGVDLRIRAGEVFTLLGPGGSGKTTILRMIAGFDKPDEGTISFGERNVGDLPPDKRNIGMVFQEYALFPHLTVAENVSFGLEARHAPKAEIEAKVRASLSRIHLDGVAQTRVADLPTAEQQRVALARALAIRPDVLLLDEPLSNLDGDLRAETRSQLRELVHDSGVTTLYATRNREEALALSDRLAILHEGHIQQTGTATEVYVSPVNETVSRLLGHRNILHGKVAAAAPYSCTVTLNGSEDSLVVPPLDAPVDAPVTVVLRPEALEIEDELAPPPRHPNRWKATVVSSEFKGAFVCHTIRLFNEELTAYQVTRESRLRKGEVGVSISPEQVHIIVREE